MRFFATAARNLEPLLGEELAEIGAPRLKLTGSGAWFGGTLADAYRVCLWSRIANAVLLEIASFEAPNEDALYEGARRIAWEDHLTLGSTFAVSTTASRSPVENTHYASLRVKDAVADRFQERHGERPSVDTNDPDVTIRLHLREEKATLSLSLNGETLNRRGWREAASEAPLRETLAAAILRRAGWKGEDAGSFPLLDPMCGAGTFPIEAWMIATDRAPGLERAFGFERWPEYDEAAWDELKREAIARAEKGAVASIAPIVGSDRSADAVHAARENAKRAGAGAQLRFEQREAREIEPRGDRPGLVIANAPYGERLGDEEGAERAHRELGRALLTRFADWRLMLLTGSVELAYTVPLRPAKRYKVYNGPTLRPLFLYEVRPERAIKRLLDPTLAAELGFEVDETRARDADAPTDDKRDDGPREGADRTREAPDELEHASPAPIHDAKALKERAGGDARAQETQGALDESPTAPAPPRPEDDGGADHLRGARIPAGIALPSTSGAPLDLAELFATTVVYTYPRIEHPDRPFSEAWDAIPGARGCTPESLAFARHAEALFALGVERIVGLSTQSLEEQIEAKARLELPFDLLCDAERTLTEALGLPTFEFEGLTLLKRLVLVVRRGAILHVDYPIFPPDEAPERLLRWFRE